MAPFEDLAIALESLSKARQRHDYFVICKYKNTGTYHIFPAEKEWLEERCTQNGSKSCCNRSFKNWELEYFSTECLTEDEVRLVCAEMAKITIITSAITAYITVKISQLKKVTGE